MNFLEIIRQPPEKHLFVQHRIDTIKTFATCTDLFNNVSKKSKRFTESFLGKNCLEINGYLSRLYSEEFFPSAQLSIDFHQRDKRKATEDPYFKHTFYTSYLTYELLKTLKYEKKQTKIFIIATLFHDAIEMRKKINPKYDENDLLHLMTDRGVDRAEAEKIFTIVNLLTPEPKETSMNTDLWIKRKRADFNYVMQISGEQVKKRYEDLFSKRLLTEEADVMAEMVKQIKIADDAAILREIKDDITNRRDHKHKRRNGIRPLRERFQVYNDRTKIIQEIYTDHPLLQQMQDDLRFIQKHLRLS